MSTNNNIISIVWENNHIFAPPPFVLNDVYSFEQLCWSFFLFLLCFFLINLFLSQFGERFSFKFPFLKIEILSFFPKNFVVIKILKNLFAVFSTHRKPCCSTTGNKNNSSEGRVRRKKRTVHLKRRTKYEGNDGESEGNGKWL